MPVKPRVTRKTARGVEIPRAMHRVAFAQATLCESSYTLTRNAVMSKFGVSKATAERDIVEAQKLIAEDAEKERPTLRARETMRLSRIADAAEDEGEYQAAVAASRGISKLNGLEVDVVSTGPLAPGQQAMVQALALTPVQRQQRLAALRAKAGTLREQAKAEAAAKPKAPEDADL